MAFKGLWENVVFQRSEWMLKIWKFNSELEVCLGEPHVHAMGTKVTQMDDIITKVPQKCRLRKFEVEFSPCEVYVRWQFQ